MTAWADRMNRAGNAPPDSGMLAADSVNCAHLTPGVEVFMRPSTGEIMCGDCWAAWKASLHTAMNLVIGGTQL